MPIGSIGTIASGWWLSGANKLCKVNFDDDDSGDVAPYTVPAEALTLLNTTPAPSEITIGGVRYTLTPVQEAEAAPEPKREPKQGEVWRNQADNYVLISEDSDDENDPRITELTGDNVGRSYFEWHSNLTFAFPDLRAAIAAGVLS